MRNMDCFEEGLIQIYIDGELHAKEEKRMEEHINECEVCRAKVDKQRIIKADVLAAINLLAKPTESAPEKKVRRLPLKKLLYAISAASVLLISIAIFKNNRNTEMYQEEIYYELDWSVDANKPITDQEFIINMYDASEFHSESSIE